MSEMHPDPRLDASLSHGAMPRSMFPPIPLPTSGPPDCAADAQPKGYFVTRDGKTFAGAHLIVDLRNAAHLDDVAYIERALVDAVNAAGASLLHIHLHHFSPGGGVSGVAVLAESHISIHTWPEHAFAALDIFMCGRCKPHDAVPVLERAFRPKSIDVQEILRGEVRS